MSFAGRWQINIKTPIGKQEALLDIGSGSDGDTAIAGWDARLPGAYAD